MTEVDVMIIGAGAAGLICAIEAGKRGRQVVLLDHANKPGKKILMSGGGRCNFTNNNIEAEHFISANPHFCKSALKRYTQWHFIDLVQQHNIAYHEREHGQLFCNNSSKDILTMLLTEASANNVQTLLNTKINKIIKQVDSTYVIETSSTNFHCQSLVIATGGLSIPKMGATPFAYKVAEQFNIPVLPTSAGLVPFTLQPEDKKHYETLSGIAINSLVSSGKIQFKENILFTHRGLSGPAILQISSYWKQGGAITIKLLPDIVLRKQLSAAITNHPQQILKTVLAQLLPKRLGPVFFKEPLLATKLHALSNAQIDFIIEQLQNWTIKPNGTEGYRTAEVTLGGIDCHQISSKTMQANHHPGLYFIGEALDVTGWLGGYNFQWAWSSGWCAGQYV
ncbi:NAD(P)/FAD-dependent oxidoreductase [Beggiatoa alba]|nr:NAD(P)/FAD-dependent oxidoreductase [Beggiatoa alba]